MEARVDLANATDVELIAEMEAMRLALGATLGQPFDGREEAKNADLHEQIKAIKAELERRNA